MTVVQPALNCVRLRLQKMKKLMIRPYEQYTGLPYRTSEKNNGPQYEQRQYIPWMPEFVRAAVIQLPLPAAVRPIFFTYRHAGSTASDRQKVNCVRSQCKFLSLAINAINVLLNAYRSRCKVKGARSKDRLAALVQDKPP